MATRTKLTERETQEKIIKDANSRLAELKAKEDAIAYDNERVAVLVRRGTLRTDSKLSAYVIGTLHEVPETDATQAFWVEKLSDIRVIRPSCGGVMYKCRGLAARFRADATNHGAEWSGKQVRDLLDWYNKGNRDVKLIATHTGRTPWACILKLHAFGVKLGEADAYAIMHACFTE